MYFEYKGTTFLIKQKEENLLDLFTDEENISNIFLNKSTPIYELAKRNREELLSGKSWLLDSKYKSPETGTPIPKLGEIWRFDLRTFYASGLYSSTRQSSSFRLRHL